MWQHLKESSKPIFLYGMGDGALKIMSVLKRFNIPIAGIYASDEFVRGHSFEGFLVLKYSDVRKKYGTEFITLLSFAAGYEPLMSQIYAKNAEHELYAPDVPVYFDGNIENMPIFDQKYFCKHEEELFMVYKALADELSKKTFINVLKFKLSGKINYLKEIESPVLEAYEIIAPQSNEVYIDLGGYTGDTVAEYLSYANGAKRIIVFEPDKKNFSKLCANLKSIYENAECLQYGAWSKTDTLYFKGGKGGRNSALSTFEIGCKQIAVTSVDEYLKGELADIIKLDVEGAEEQALIGCKNTIEKFHPRFMLSAYHRNDDLFRLPLHFMSQQKVYKLFFRHHPYIPNWETNFYIV